MLSEFPLHFIYLFVDAWIGINMTTDIGFYLLEGIFTSIKSNLFRVMKARSLMEDAPVAMEHRPSRHFHSPGVYGDCASDGRLLHQSFASVVVCYNATNMFCLMELASH